MQERTRSTRSTRSRLIGSAAHLFRIKGFNGTGLSEVLSHSKTPKGSLYHHFPKGKADLARASADLVSEGMLEIIDAAFERAESFEDGGTTLCFKLAKLFDKGEEWQGCPISSVLLDGSQHPGFRDHADQIFTNWVARVAGYGQVHGLIGDEACAASEHLLFAIHGAWVMCRARGNADLLRRVPRYLYGA